MISLELLFAAALNHLLEAEPWARERLAPFAGETFEVRSPPLPSLCFSVAGGGCLRPAGEAEQRSLTLTLGPEALAALLKGEENFLRAIEISGNASFANEVLFLFRHLRWDAEEDLAKTIGDAPAHRLAGWARDFAAWQKDALVRLADSFMSYAVEEQRLLVSRSGFAGLQRGVAQLRDALERLEKRVERLAR